MYTFVAVLLLAVANAEERIINGADATSTKIAPWQVSLQQSGSHFCGGTVISATHVMSAGHCKTSNIVSRFTVNVGGVDYRNLDQQLSMSNWVVHPQFTQRGGINYDYSVITVSSAITLSPGFVEAATLPASGQEFTGNAIISGWGKTKGSGIGSNTLPTTLQWVELPILSDAECKAVWGRSSITPQSICVGSSSAGTGACNGDSGGPMVQTDSNGVTWLIGNTSWGASSCDAYSYPTIYSKNSAVADWIQQQL